MINIKVGFIGLGIMGESMCENIIVKSDYEVIVYDIVEEKIEKLVKKGGIKAFSIEEVGHRADVIVTMIPTNDHVKEVYSKLIKTVDSSKVLIDMSTISPAVSKEIAKEVANKGGVMLDAPVVKSKTAAIKGTLGIYVGGDKETFEKVKGLLSYMGSNIIHMGDNGTGLVMKICHNMLVGEIQNGVNEMLTLASRLGIDLNDFITAISYGGGQNFYLDTKGKTIIANDFTTAFSVENMHKDVNIASEMIDEIGLKLPGLKIVKDVYKKAMEAGFAKEDFSATYKIYKNL